MHNYGNLLEGLSPLEKMNFSPGTMAASYAVPQWEPAKHIRLINNTLMEMIFGDLRRLIVTMPPRHGKSTLLSIWLPIWLMTRLNYKELMLISNTAELAVDWSVKARDTLQYNSEFLGAFPTGRQQQKQWESSTGSVLRAIGMGGSITGRGADWLIVDDPVKNAEQAMSETYRENAADWFASTAYTRLQKDARAIIICTRWHEDDLVGRVIEQNPEEWSRRIDFPAIAEHDDELGREPGDALWPEFFPIEKLLEIKKQIPQKWWDALYMQKPSGGEGALVDDDWWRYYKKDELPPWNECVTRIIAWDTSNKGEDSRSFSVGMVIGMTADKNIYIYDFFRGRPGFIDLVHEVRRFHIEWPGARTVIEDAAAGHSVAEVVTANEPYVPAELVTVSKSKPARLNNVVHVIEAGDVKLPLKADWVPAFKKEVASFPFGTYDDQVDVLSLGLGQVLLDTDVPFLIL